MLDINDSFYQTLVENVPVLLKIIDQNGVGKFFNKRWLDFTGRTLEQETGGGWLEGLHPEDIQVYLEAVKAACWNRQNTRNEYRLRGADGVFRWILEEGKPVFAVEGELKWYIGSGLDITEQKLLQENSGSNIYFDSFTGIPNRRFFDDYLRREWGRAARTVRSLTLVLCSASHRQENHYDLKLLGSTINSELNRPGDFLALYNDEKFAVILPETDEQGAAVVVDKIRTRVQALATGHSVPAIGLVSVVPTIDVSTAAELVELAEQAMQEAKKQIK